MEVVFIVLLLLLAASTWVFFAKAQDAKGRLSAALAVSGSVEGRLDELRKELGAAREDAARKAKALEEVRAEAKKKARREGKKMQRENETDAEESPVSSSGEAREEVTRLKHAISGLEAQLTELKAEAARSAAEVREALKGEYEGKLKAARDELGAVQKTLDELRESIRKKAEDRPDVPGSAVDLKALPADAVQELARYFRKGEEFERLYGVAQGRLQLAQERTQELQKRYYAVCRELALLTGNVDGKSDEEVRKIAEGAVNRSDEASAAAAGPTGPAAEVSEEGAAKKKRRRRRRKRKAGDAAASAEGADDAGADEGDDEGDDDGDDVAGDADAASVSSDEAPAGDLSAPPPEAAPEARPSPEG